MTNLLPNLCRNCKKSSVCKYICLARDLEEEIERELRELAGENSPFSINLSCIYRENELAFNQSPIYRDPLYESFKSVE